MSDTNVISKQRRDRRNGVILAVVLIVGALLLFGGDDSTADAGPVYPAGAYAECNAFRDLEDRFRAGDVSSSALVHAVLDIVQAAEGGPVEAEATELLDALTSGDDARNHAAINAMRSACGG